MRMHSVVVSLIGLSCLASVGCGGSQPKAEEPSAKSAPAEESKKDASSDEAKKDEAKAETKSDTKSADASSPEVKRTAKDIITAPEVTFMFNFNDSEPKEKAEKACDAEARDDPKKMALCMKKASSKFEADGMQFKSIKGQWTWVTLRRKGSSITVLHSIPVDFGDDKPTSVVLKPTGKDSGKQPMAKVPSEVLIEVPNEFEIALKDPTYGRMVYEAKIGIMSDEKAK
jgi:hypothetical protein